MRLLPSYIRLPKTKIGSLPEFSAFIPENLLTMTGVLVATTATLYISDQLSHGNPNSAVVSTAAVLGSLWLYGRLSSRDLRDGWILDKPWQSSKKTTQKVSNANWEITQHFQSKGIQGVVTETRSEQYRILKINNLNPKKVKEQLPALSMILGMDQGRLQFIQVYKKQTSAILIPKEQTDWDDVPFTTKPLIKGRLMGYVGISIKGHHTTYDRRNDPHLLIAGRTNSGKTIAMKVDMESMRQSGLNPIIYIIDPKNDLTTELCDFYTDDIETGINKLERLLVLAKERKDRYTASGCANYFEYQAQIDKTERPILIYMDEATDMFEKNEGERVEKDEAPLHKRGFNVVHILVRKWRAAGIFITIGLQNPKTENLRSQIRNELGVRIILALADKNASRVAIDQSGAETLPLFGGFMFTDSLNNTAPIIGRGAYLN